MSLLALPRPVFRQGCLLSQLSQGSCISCFHTSASIQAKGKKSAVERKRTRSIPNDDDPAAAWNSRPLASRKRLVKDLLPRSAGKEKHARLIVAKRAKVRPPPPPPPIIPPVVRDSVPHADAQVARKDNEHQEQEMLEKRLAWREARARRADRRTGARDKQQSEWMALRSSKSHAATGTGQHKPPARPFSSKRELHAGHTVPESDHEHSRDAERADSGSSSTSKKPSVYNPLVDELDVSARAETLRALPREFTSPPLMEGLLTSVTDFLGPEARPTDIQSLSLKHLFPRPLPGYPSNVNAWGAPTKNKSEYLQCLLASETGSGKSIAYLLPMLQDLKLKELRTDAPRPQNSGCPLNPRALVLAPTHELSRQLSSFAKALLHHIKLRVLCASKSNTPSTPSRNVSSAKMAKEMDELFKGSSARKVEEKQAVEDHAVDVVVGTPSKILEMVKGRGWDHQVTLEQEPNVWEGEGKRRLSTVGKPEMSLESIEWVVIDEADVLFDPDFQADTKSILSSISEARKQPLDFPSVPATPSSPAPLNYPFNLLLSTATIPSALAWHLDSYHPSLIRLASPNLHRLPSTLRTEYVGWTGGNRNVDIEKRLRNVWAQDVPTRRNRKVQFSKVLVFCNKSTRVEELGQYLTEKGIPNVALTSTSETRKWGSNHHLDGFLREHSHTAKDEKLASEASLEQSSSSDAPAYTQKPHVMITTSLLSRGLDFAPEIKHVFIVDEPRNMVDFLHRAGRSGRAGERGKVVVFGKTEGRGSNRTKIMRKRVGALLA